MKEESNKSEVKEISNKYTLHPKPIYLRTSHQGHRHLSRHPEASHVSADTAGSTRFRA